MGRVAHSAGDLSGLVEERNEERTSRNLSECVADALGGNRGIETSALRCNRNKGTKRRPKLLSFGRRSPEARRETRLRSSKARKR
ncbi:hypothetical protein L596_014374 [Steinernema carpocapsae]|uniref:Uncharacterized protein n=1 Tax=Steinernema carpocapsae TaxID=34508 RepID=A0A4U5NBT3_STECR|nr:hypothetical protein L596_014374 [Steinernema carpocapsae]